VVLGTTTGVTNGIPQALQFTLKLRLRQSYRIVPTTSAPVFDDDAIGGNVQAKPVFRRNTKNGDSSGAD